MFHRIRFITASCLISGSVAAQAPTDEEDLEIPAAPAPGAAPVAPGATPAPPAPLAPAPGATPPPGAVPAAPGAPGPAAPAPAVPGPAAAAPSPAAPAVPSEAALARIAELEARLAAVEQRAAAAVVAEPPASEPAPQDEPPSAAPPPPRIGPAFPWIPDGSLLTGWVQAQFHHSALSEDQLQQGGVPLNQDGFYLRTARLRLERGWEFVGGAVELEALTWNRPDVGVRAGEVSVFYRGGRAPAELPVVALTAGVTELPFGYELGEAARVRPFMERSIASNAFFPTQMDAGVKLWGALGFFTYALAVSNGEPLDLRSLPRDPNAAKDVSGRLGALVAPTDATVVWGGTSFSVGKGFHPGSEATKSAVLWRDDNENGISEAGEIQGFPGSAAAPSENFTRWLMGLDLGVAWRTSLGRSQLLAEVYAGSNHDRGLLVADPIATGADVREVGGYLAFTQELTPYVLVGLRGEVYDPDADFMESRGGRNVLRSRVIRALSPLVALQWQDRARLIFQYDFIQDQLGRDAAGAPEALDNDAWTARLQVDL